MTIAITRTSSSTTATAGSRPSTVAKAMNRPGHQISDDTLVDKALEILCGAQVDHLLVSGSDGRCVGLVTRAQLAPYLPRSWYTARTPVRSIVRQSGPFAWPGMAIGSAAEAMRIREFDAWPVVDDDGYAVGVLYLEKAEAAVAVGSFVGAIAA
ncbi:CBS domain-containing protein [Kitasatospora sp. MAA4]|uniref:CBS domain-containing protein n=1 Tax=Kitasatospora sp. MAA4 TaxID=3035093 RepID=UPI002476AB65|nr:CBS domain-containing protein [Kitasatospora sp. MAA4]MDH6133933.1 CBS domain-containing protein [Kitasatospora sp. MAA4]